MNHKDIGGRIEATDDVEDVQDVVPTPWPGWVPRLTSSRIRKLLVPFAVLLGSLGITLSVPSPAQAYYVDTTWGTPGLVAPLTNMTVRGSGRSGFVVGGISIYRNGKVPWDTQQQAITTVILQKYNTSTGVWYAVDSLSDGNMLLNMGTPTNNTGPAGVGIRGGWVLSGTGPGYYRQVYRVWWGWGQALPYWTLNDTGGLSGYKQVLPNTNFACSVSCVTYNGYVYVY